MEFEETYATSLLRLIIGFLHISLSQQLALARHGKAFESLSQAEKDTLANDMVNAVMTIARQVNEETMRNFLKTASTSTSSRQSSLTDHTIHAYSCGIISGIRLWWRGLTAILTANVIARVSPMSGEANPRDFMSSFFSN